MSNTIRNKTATGGVLAVMFAFSVPVSALDSELFLQASPSMMLHEVSSSTLTGEEGGKSGLSGGHSVSDGADMQSRKLPLLKLRELLGTFRQEDMKHEDESIITSDDMSSVHVAKVSDMSATLAWSSPKLTNVTIFYSPTSPVHVSDKTQSASPWKLLNIKQVTLRGLSPNTTYHYKIVAVTALGTTTSAEASFKTVAR